jgi:ATP-binding cassette subfamily F protein 3
LLFLDEPTNHLDIPAAEILEEALTGFEGTVLLVSHDRRFLENVTTRTIALRAGVCDIYPGGFRDFVDAEARRADKTAAALAPRAEKGPGKAETRAKKERAAVAHDRTGKERDGQDDRGSRRAAFEQEKAEARLAERKIKRVAELEDLIAAVEAKVVALRDLLKQDPGGDWEKIANLAREEQALTKRVESMMSEWTTLSEEVTRDRASSAAAAAIVEGETQSKGGEP